jgi:urease accessory protein
MSDSNLLSLLQLTDSMLPVGAYAHSSGLETYVQKGLVKDLASAREFVTGMISVNLHYTDVAFVSLAYNAALQHDWQKILELDEECTAVKLPAEIRLGSQKLGMRLLKIFEPICADPVASRYKTAIHEQAASGHYCIAFGICAAAMKIPKPSALTGFYYSASAGMVTNCVKLIPLGQQDGQELLFSLQALISDLVQQSLAPDITRIGLCCPAFDLRCMQHEALYSRLYMS